jgi:HNH endonuclease
MQEQLNIIESHYEGQIVRSHPDYPMFRVTDDGRVLGARGFWLKTKPQKSGHTSVCYFNAEKKQCYIHVHRLVALCYVPNLDPAVNTIVDHRDNDPANNHYTNLRWVTARQNCQNLAMTKNGATSSKYVGVGWHKEDRRWRAQIRLHGKNRGSAASKWKRMPPGRMMLRYSRPVSRQ